MRPFKAGDCVMSVRSLVVVVIGVVAFVVIDNLNKVMGSLRRNPQINCWLIRGSLNTGRGVLAMRGQWA